MSIKVNTIGLFLLLFVSVSCSNSDEQDGLWEDNIHLSQKEIQFTAEKNTTAITTEGTWWWIHGVSLNGNWDFDLSEIDTTKDNFIINEAEFTIERKNATEIHIEMTKNETGSERTLVIGLQAGDYFDGIEVTQAAK